MLKKSPYSNYLNHFIWLRFFCIFCIFLLHTGLTFSYIPELIPFWYFKSEWVSIIITGFCAFANSACMPLFFFLSGIGAFQRISSGDMSYFNRRTKKWLKIIIYNWPVIAASILTTSFFLDKQPIFLLKIAFPSSNSYSTSNLLPFNFFHLWYLFVLLLIEGLMIFTYPFIRKNFKPIYLLSLPFFQMGIILIQNQGYMMVPLTIDVYSLGSIFIYWGWFIAGWIFSSLDVSKLYINPKKIRFFFSVNIIGFFISKFTLLFIDNDHLTLLNQFCISFFDSLLPWAVLSIWFDLINQDSFHALTLKFQIFERFLNKVIKYALDIYILQIPVIFGILSILVNFKEPVIFFKTIDESKLNESQFALFYWMLLTFSTAIIISVIIHFKNRIKFPLLNWH